MVTSQRTDHASGLRLVDRPDPRPDRPRPGVVEFGPVDARTCSFTTPFYDASFLPELRAWLRRHLSTVADRQVDAELVCTELVANAIDHASGPCAVRLQVQGPTLTVEVDDASPHAVLLVGRSRLHEGRGRGLAMVDALSRWGVHRAARGKTVWAALDVA